MSESAATRLSEAQFQRQVIEFAQLTGWRVYHTYNSRRSAAGFPDLILVRGERQIAAELKTDTGRLSDEQREWLQALEGAGAESCVWRPKDFDTIVECLRRRERTAA